MYARRPSAAMPREGPPWQRLPKREEELMSESPLIHSDSNEPLETHLIPPSRIHDEKENPLNIQNALSQIDVSSLGTFNTPFNGLLVAIAKVENLRTKILVDNAAEVNFID